MLIRSIRPGLALLLTMAAAPAFAQTKEQVGVVLSYPSLGIIWQASDTIALRPEISFTHGSTSSPSSFGETVTATTWTVGTGLSANFYFPETDHVRTYVCPRLSYTRGKSGNSPAASQWGIGGSFGAEASVAPRLRIFGEIGVAYSHAAIDSGSALLGTIRQSAIGTRTSVGLAYYF